MALLLPAAAETKTVVKDWKRLSTEAVESPSLELFKTQLNTALSSS